MMPEPTNSINPITQIKIGGKTFSVVFEDNLCDDKGNLLCGACNASKQIIRINPSYPVENHMKYLKL